MATNFTEQQRTAVERRGTSIVLASGAGCGKTFVLTARYLSHLMADAAEVGQIVAITFTERAAREMRGRIRAAVEERLRAADPASEAFTHWQRHKRNLDTAPINTIHGFCGTLLRQYGAAARLDPTFDVLNEPLAATLRAEALRDELYRLLTDQSDTGQDLRELVVLFGWHATRDAIDELLLDPDPPAWETWLARDPEDIAAAWLGSERSKLLPGWVGYLCAASPKIAPCLNLLAYVTPATPEAKCTVARLLTEVPRLHEAKDFAGSIAELCELAKISHTGKKGWPDEETYTAMRDAFTAFRGDLEKRFTVFTEEPEGVEESARIGERFLRVATAADTAYRARKTRAAALDFHDLLVLARDLLKQHEEVRAAVRERFRFILLDELQDTDPVQMELVELLCGGGLHHGKLFAVGDAKQSIYRFRGAEVELFRGLRDAVPETGRLGLTKNFRSQPGVLKFVNALCELRVPGYEPLETDTPQGMFGNVELLWSVPAPKPTDDRPWAFSETVADIRAREADAIAQRVVQLLESNEARIHQKDGTFRAVRPKDVVLLFRSMTSVATYETALRRHGLDYYLVGGRAFFAQQEVYDLLNLLRAVENPQDGPALAGTLRSPFCCLSDEALHLIGTHKEGLWAGLFDAERFNRLPAEQKPMVERARRFLARWRSLKDQLPIARLLGQVFAESGYDAAMQFEFLADRKLANLWKLLDLARDFDQSGFGLSEFIARLGDLVTRQPREEQAATQPEESDVVKLMSIHQAKGLEFPVVIVPDIGAASRGNQYPIARWHRQLGCLVRLPADLEDDPPFAEFPDKLGRVADQLADWQEDLRVLYVACTRARDVLILSAGLVEPIADVKPASHWMLALAERFNLRTGMGVVDGISAHVRVVERGLEVKEVKLNGEARKPTNDRPWALQPITLTLPAVISLCALEQFAHGEPISTIADVCADSWLPLRDRLAPLSACESTFWAVLRRWDFADLDGWRPLLAEALGELPDLSAANRLAEELKPLFERFAVSEVRGQLAGAAERFVEIEFLFNLTHALATTDTPNPRLPGARPVLRGLVDLLVRDGDGWHLYGVHLTERAGRHPWRERKPWLTAQAWAVSQRFAAWPRTVGLLDLVNGEVFTESGKTLKAAAGFGPMCGALKSWLGQFA